jgi:hypothetical protein
VHKAAIWSDQPPEKDVSTTYAHDKGMFFVDERNGSGFQLTHSVPKFPIIKDNKIDPQTNPESNYGQSFVCIGLTGGSKPHFTNVHKLLVAAKTWIYFDNTGYGDVKNVATSPVSVLKNRMLDAYTEVIQGSLFGAFRKALGIKSTEEKMMKTDRLFEGEGPSLLPFPNSPFVLISKSQKFQVPVFNDFLIPGISKAFPTLPKEFGLA